MRSTAFYRELLANAEAFASANAIPEGFDGAVENVRWKFEIMKTRDWNRQHERSLSAESHEHFTFDFMSGGINWGLDEVEVLRGFGVKIPLL